MSERLLIDLGRDLDLTRSRLDLSLRDVGQEAGLSHAQVSRILRAQHRHVALEDLVSLAVVLGLDLSVRAYPGGAPLRDLAHVRLLERLHAVLHPSLGWKVEVPVTADPLDRRGWDALIHDPAWRMGVEAETRLRDAQEVERRAALKSRDGRVDHVMLLLADTRWNRRALMAARAGLRTLFPADGRVIIDALRTGHDPGGSGIVLL